jgi:hypothetical protein
MRHRRGTAVVGALLCAALATAGCGLGPGADVGEVQLTVTREYGAVPVLDKSVAANESDTVMRVLEGEAEISTRYGGGFVHSIDGVAEGQHGGEPYDWFFYLDGVEWPVGAAETDLKGGERIWWDYRNWGTTNHVPAVVGSWPAPFSDGIAGVAAPAAVECEDARAACKEVSTALEREGVKVVDTQTDDTILVLVGPWERVRKNPIAHLIEAGPAESGVFADFASASPREPSNSERSRGLAKSFVLVALDQGGGVAESLGSDVGLVAATSRYGGLPVWIVTGGTTAGVREAAGALDAEHLRDHYAVAIDHDKTVPLPLVAR